MKLNIMIIKQKSLKLLKEHSIQLREIESENVTELIKL